MIENLKIIGTSHISIESKKKIIKTFQEFNPDIVAVELDYNRFMGLKSKSKPKKSFSLFRQLGFSGSLFYIIGEFLQKKLGKIVKLEPGADMISAIKEAEKNGKELKLIDRDIRLTLQRFSKYFSFKEKMRILGDLTFGYFKKEKIDIDLNSVPDEEIIDKIIFQTKERYPNLYKVLIDERDQIMAKKLFILLRNNPGKRIMCVVGAGHYKGINKYLKNYIDSNIIL